MLLGAGRVFTWGLGTHGQLANNELKGRLVGLYKYSRTSKLRISLCNSEAIISESIG